MTDVIFVVLVLTLAIGGSVLVYRTQRRPRLTANGEPSSRKDALIRVVMIAVAAGFAGLGIYILSH